MSPAHLMRTCGACLRTAGFFDVKPGDICLMITDGILETNNQHEEEVGLTRAEEILRAGSEMPLRSLGEKIFRTVAELGAQTDDQTLLLLRFRD